MRAANQTFMPEEFFKSRRWSILNKVVVFPPVLKQNLAH